MPSGKPGTPNRWFQGTPNFGTQVQTAAGDSLMILRYSVLVLNKASGAATAVSLPRSPAAGDLVVIKDGKGDAATYNITISDPASNTIDGAASLVVSLAYGYVMLVFNGTQWNVVAKDSGTDAFDTLTVNAIVGGDASLGITGAAPATTSSAGGAVPIVGGVGGSVSGVGGAAGVTGGAGTAGNSAGGVANTTGGAGQGSAAGGIGKTVGGVGGATGAGGAAQVTGGAGGATSGTGGAAAVAGGAGSGVGAAGGAASVTGGAAAVGTTTTPGGAGAAASLAGSAGGAKTGTGAAAGGAGGAAAVTGGVGGATASSGTDAGGVGGAVSNTAGNGGAASAGTGNGGKGGSIINTPGTGGASAGGTAGVNGVIIDRGVKLVKQGTQTAKTTSATLTAAEVLAGIITVNQGGAGASALQLPAGSALDTALPDAANDDAFDFSVINISTVAAETASLTTNTNLTLVGDMDIQANSAATTKSAARFRLRRTTTATWTCYRLA